MTSKKFNNLRDLYIDDILLSTCNISNTDRLLNHFTSDILYKDTKIAFDPKNYNDAHYLFYISETLRASDTPNHFDAFNVFLRENNKSKNKMFNDFALSLHEPNKEILKNSDKILKMIDFRSEGDSIIIASHIAQQAFVFSELKLLCEMYEVINTINHDFDCVKFYTLGLVGILAGNWNFQETLYTNLRMFPNESNWINKTFKYLSIQRRIIK